MIKKSRWTNQSKTKRLRNRIGLKRGINSKFKKGKVLKIFTKDYFIFALTANLLLG
jgi:hypothetical protein